MWNCEVGGGGGGGGSGGAAGGGGGVGYQLPDVQQVQMIQQHQHFNRWGGDLELASSPYFLLDVAWGSDLELASPGGFDSCIMDSSWTSSKEQQHCCATAAQGLETVPSPTSSAVSIRNLSHHGSQQQNLLPGRQQQHQYQDQPHFHQEQHHYNQEHQQQQQHSLQTANNSSDHQVDVSSSSSVSSMLNRASISGNSAAAGAAEHSDGQNHHHHHHNHYNHRHHHRHHHHHHQHHHHQQQQQQQQQQEQLPQQQRSNCGDESVGSPSGGSIPHDGGGEGGDNNGGVAATVAAANDLVDVSNKMETSSSNGLRGPTERMMDISLEDLSRYFTMPITQASKELKVGLTVLKKRCREFGIPRWPHRKLKSLESLIHKSQELAKDSDGNAPNPVIHAVHELERQKKKMEESPGMELDDRTKRFRQAIFKASYKQRRRAVVPGRNCGANSDSSHNDGSTGYDHQEQDQHQSMGYDPSQHQEEQDQHQQLEQHQLQQQQQ